MESNKDTVQVAVRIRPLVISEIETGCKCVIEKVHGAPQIHINSQNPSKTNDSFTFNYVLPKDETQENIYSQCIKHNLKKLFDGYNVTILAYGQTGSGKTYTMGTAYDGTYNSESGIIPRAINDIFHQIGEMSNHTFSVTCTFMELYQEQLFDLLSPMSREQSIVDIREDFNKEIIIPNLTEKTVTTIQETVQCLLKGSTGRIVGATAMNALSSRSHAIFTITIIMQRIDDVNTLTKSRFHLVDLAGSERSKKTKATGERFKEGVKINQGLLALGNVISALGTNQNNAYISYRDSKLTRLLQDSLGGNSITLMIACISPADYNIEESLSTLRYADRAKQIKNKPIVNQDPKTAEINRLNVIIQKLRVDLLMSNNGNLSGYLAMDKVDQIHKELLMENTNLRKKLEFTLCEAANMEHRLNEAETLNDDLQTKFSNLRSKIINLNTSFNVETCPAEFVIHARAIDELRQMTNDINELVKQNTENLCDKSNNVIATNDSIDVDDDDDNMMAGGMGSEEEIRHKEDKFNSLQVVLRDELRDIQQRLAMKEDLYNKLNINLNNRTTYEDGKYQTTSKDYEAIIQTLEKEKEELMKENLRNKSGISAKLAEERRKRVLQLELEINDAKKKNKQQALLLKQKEKDTQKIDILQREIKEMKRLKVQLIKRMKKESEDHRRWRMQLNKENLLLKEKDRKRQHEMQKKDVLHEKQRNVLKRKVDESVAIIKRLKEAIDKNHSANAHRHRDNVKSDKIDHISKWMDQEIELIFYVIDAKNSLEQLQEDHRLLNTRLLQLNSNKVMNKNEIVQLEEDINMRSAQIGELNNKIKTTDIDIIIKNVCDGIHSLPHARTSIKHLFDKLSTKHSDYLSHLDKFNDLRSDYDTNKEKLQEIEHQYKDQMDDLNQEINKIQKECEEKISVLLRELNSHSVETESTAECNKIREDIVETLQAKNEKYEAEIASLKEKLVKKSSKGLSLQPRIAKLQADEDLSTSIESLVDDDKKDPDWYEKTPVAVKRNSHVLAKSEDDEQDEEGDSDVEDVVKKRKLFQKKNSSDAGCCSCKTNCQRKQCGCKKRNTSCSELCKCDKTLCLNTDNTSLSKIKHESMNESDIENSENNQLMANSLLPNTPFRQTIGAFDLNTPSYPYEHKTRPLLVDQSTREYYGQKN